MNQDRILITEDEIQDKVKELAERINNDYAGKNVLIIGILKGAFMFTADIVRHLRIPIEIDFILSSSYIGTASTEEVKIHYDVREPIRNRHVIIIEDIADTGITLNYIRQRLIQQMPASLKICALLDKKIRRSVDVPLDYVGFEIGDEFVVGYGTDYNDKYRNLPYISAISKNKS
ncbi:Hypoxanthine phosphoribosyl transferase [Candidatus Magnetoovum chiemensis]|nr:Hypoxanthine phosphoribosyl transferase [Candidatus Magnetoovum chiemensis]